MSDKTQKIIDDLKAVIKTEEALEIVDTDKLEALKAQVRELEALSDDGIPFERSEVDEYITEARTGNNNHPGIEGLAPNLETPDEEQETPDEGKLIMVSKLKGRPLEEIYGYVDTFKETAEKLGADELDLVQLMNQAIDQYKLAQKEYDTFVAGNKDLFDLKSTMSFERTKMERTIAGLAARFAERNVRIHEGEKEGLWDITVKDADTVPDGVGFQISYQISPAAQNKKIEVINDPDLTQWAVRWNQTLLAIDKKVMEQLVKDPMVAQTLNLIQSAVTLDANKVEDYMKHLRELSLGDQTQELLPVDMPPASIKPYIQPTVGKISYELDS